MRVFGCFAAPRQNHLRKKLRILRAIERERARDRLLKSHRRRSFPAGKSPRLASCESALRCAARPILKRRAPGCAASGDSASIVCDASARAASHSAASMRFIAGCRASPDAIACCARDKAAGMPASEEGRHICRKTPRSTISPGAELGRVDFLSLPQELRRSPRACRLPRRRQREPRKCPGCAASGKLPRQGPIERAHAGRGPGGFRWASPARRSGQAFRGFRVG